MLLKDKVAIITGSSRGIGRGIALRFAREGCKVVVNGRHSETVHATVEEIRTTGGAALEVEADITVETDVERLFTETLANFGTVDILVNNAQSPVALTKRVPFLKMTAEGWNAYMHANLGALFYCTHRAAQIMAAKRRGSIINISTNGASRPHRRAIAYDSAKGALDSFTRAVAIDLAPWGIRVNGLRPGLIAGDSWARTSEEGKARQRATIPLGREGRPEDMAWAALFLAADDAAYITGQIFDVDGGLLVQGRAPCAEYQPVIGPDNIGTIF